MDLYIQRICFDCHAWEKDHGGSPVETDAPGGGSLSYPFSLPAVRWLIAAESFPFRAPVTVFIGENGSGKSTLLEGIAVCFGLNPEGGSRNFRFFTYSSHSRLGDYLYYSRIRRPRDAYFLRAESFYNVATEIERRDSEPSFDPPLKEAYGNVNLHEKSHGESFFLLLEKRFRGNGLYLMDEPEAAVSVSRQLAMLRIIRRLEEHDSQLILATHSPILMAYPGADLVRIDASGMTRVSYEETEQYRVMRHFMLDYRAALRECMS